MASTRPLTFAELLRRYRRAAHLSQETLAELAGLSRRAVSDLERTPQRVPRQDTAELLAEALGLAAQERTRFLAVARRYWVQGTLAVPGFARPNPTTPLHQAILTPLVGRGEELARLERQLQGTEPPVLLLAGEPGIGKTRLLRETAERARREGWTVLEGGCHRGDAQGPYAPLLGALAHHLAGQSPSQLQINLQGCAWLVRLLPELEETAVVPLDTWSLPPEQARRLLFAAVARFLHNVAGPSGTLLVLDDLQWAGQDALNVLASLMREPPVPPVRLLGAYRTTEVHPGDDLSALLVDLLREGLLAQTRIQPLEGPEAAELLGMALLGREDAAVVQRVLQRCGGVPFFLLSCARALHVGALADARADVPWDAAASIRQRVAALPAGARHLLGVAAAIGRTAPRALLGAVLARPEDEVLTLAETSCAAGLLLESGSEEYEFAHDLIREVVEGDLSAGRRRLLHRRIAEAQEHSATAVGPEAVAYHFEQGGVLAKAIGYLEQAATQAHRAGAFVEAQRHIQRALAIAPPEEQLRLYELQGDCAAYGEAAVEGYQRALEHWRQTPVHTSGHDSEEALTGARILRKLLTSYRRNSTALSVQPRNEELQALAAELLRLAEAAGHAEELWRARLVSFWWRTNGDPLTAAEIEAQRTVAVSAAAHFEAQGDWVSLSHALDASISAAWEAGDGPAAVETARRWLATPDIPLAERGAAFARATTTCEMLGDYPACLSTARWMVTQIQPGELVVHLNAGFQHAAMAAWLSGSWADHTAIMAVIEQVWEQVQHAPTVVTLLAGYQSTLFIALAREDRAAINAVVPVLETVLHAEWRAGNRALIAAHVQDEPALLDLTLPLTGITMLTALTLMFLSERDRSAPRAYLEAAKAEALADKWDAPCRCVVIAEAVATRDNARLATAIDAAEAHGLVPHAARMRIVLAQRTGDRKVLDRARSALERLGDRQFLRRLDAVAAALPAWRGSAQ